MANSVRPMVHGNSNLAAPRSGLSRAPAPTYLCRQFYRRKFASLFADFTLQKDTVKAVQSFPLRHRFDFVI